MSQIDRPIQLLFTTLSCVKMAEPIETPYVCVCGLVGAHVTIH